MYIHNGEEKKRNTNIKVYLHKRFIIFIIKDPKKSINIWYQQTHETTFTPNSVFPECFISFPLHPFSDSNVDIFIKINSFVYIINSFVYIINRFVYIINSFVYIFHILIKLFTEKHLGKQFELYEYSILRCQLILMFSAVWCVSIGFSLLSIV